MSRLSKSEANWIKNLEKLLESCPERFGLYTIGDAELGIYDKTKEHLFDNSEEFVREIATHNADLGEVRFPTLVHSVAG